MAVEIYGWDEDDLLVLTYCPLLSLAQPDTPKFSKCTSLPTLNVNCSCLVEPSHDDLSAGFVVNLGVDGPSVLLILEVADASGTVEGPFSIKDVS